MTMQNNINIIRRNIWRNMFQPKSQALALKIDNQRPLGIAVAISAHNRDRRADGAQFIQNYFRANIAQVPDLIRVARKIDNFLRQLVMSVRDNENPKHQHLKKAGMQEGKDHSPISVSWVPAFLRDFFVDLGALRARP
ncbi:MAG: hypothetical protein QOF93_1482 [Verrucomicrobiota bacterium]